MKIRVKLNKTVAKIALVSMVGLWATSLCLLYILVNMLMSDGEVIVREKNIFILVFEIIFFAVVSISCVVGVIWMVKGGDAKRDK